MNMYIRKPEVDEVNFGKSDVLMSHVGVKHRGQGNMKEKIQEECRDEMRVCGRRPFNLNLDT